MCTNALPCEMEIVMKPQTVDIRDAQYYQPILACKWIKKKIPIVAHIITWYRQWLLLPQLNTQLRHLVPSLRCSSQCDMMVVGCHRKFVMSHIMWWIWSVLFKFCTRNKYNIILSIAWWASKYVRVRRLMLCFNSLVVSPIRSGEKKIWSELVIDQKVWKNQILAANPI